MIEKGLIFKHIVFISVNERCYERDSWPLKIIHFLKILNLTSAIIFKVSKTHVIYLWKKLLKPSPDNEKRYNAFSFSTHMCWIRLTSTLTVVLHCTQGQNFKSLKIFKELFVHIFVNYGNDPFLVVTPWRFQNKFYECLQSCHTEVEVCRLDSLISSSSIFSFIVFQLVALQMPRYL